MRTPVRTALALVALPLLLTAAAPAQEVYMTGLANPRGLFFDADGALLVAEAGSGGGANGVPITTGNGAGTFGLTGGVSSRLGAGLQTRILSGLPSIAPADGSEATGPADLARAADGRLALLFGLAAGSTVRGTLGAPGASLGTLSLFDGAGISTLDRDYAAREEATNPDGGEINANPYGFVRDGAGFAVADGGANALWRDSGTVPMPTQPAVNPFNGMPMMQQSVPTSLLARPDGFLVAELGGFPFTLGASRLHSVGADGGYLGATKPGLTSVVDIADAPDGSLLVVEIYGQGLLARGLGDLKRIRPDGTVEILVDGLTAPTSVAYRDGSIYLTNNALSPTGGEVLRYGYTPVPEPATLAALGFGALALLRRRRTS